MLFSVCSVLQFYKTCLLTSFPSSNPQYPNASSTGSLKLSWWLPYFWSFLTFLSPLFDQVLLLVINLAFEPITGWGFGFGNLTSEWTIWLLNCFLVALGFGFWTTLSLFWLTPLALECWIKGIPALFSPQNVTTWKGTCPDPPTWEGHWRLLLTSCVALSKLFIFSEHLFSQWEKWR